MAQQARAGNQSEKQKCGVIMPISETTSHTENHWMEVRTLLHRGITESGFEPANVWESSTNDRISERIIGNIFNYQICVVDISDQNPNVMFELGLRLSSKKPTIIVSENGSNIPFDIKDFEVIFYPSDMSMISMEKFLRELSTKLKSKNESANSESYVPFLSNVIIDVASPETREVAFNQLVLDRLDTIARRVSNIEYTKNQITRNMLKEPALPRASGHFVYEVPINNLQLFNEEVSKFVEVDEIETSTSGIADKYIVSINYSGAYSLSNLRSKIDEVALKYNAEEEIPF